MKLFRNKVNGACQYCAFSRQESEDTLLCTQKNKTCSPEDHCRHFKYDPLKRVPSKAKALDFSKYEEFDYSL